MRSRWRCWNANDGFDKWTEGQEILAGTSEDAGSKNRECPRFCALAALTTHAQAGRAVPRQMLDDLAAFQRNLFTNQRVRALADAVRAGKTTLPDPDPKLNALEKRGKAVFERACAQCHGGPRQTLTPPPIPFRFGDISTQCPRPVDSATPARFNFAPCPPRLARNARRLAPSQSAPSLTRSGDPNTTQ